MNIALVLAFNLAGMVWAGSAIHQDDPYNSYYKRDDILDIIPRLGSDNFLVNIRDFQKRGRYFLSDLVQKNEYKKTVFKIKMEREKIVLADPIAIQAFYDTTKVMKSKIQGVFEYNALSTRGYVPSTFDTKTNHFIKKGRHLRFLAKRVRKLGLRGLFRLLSKEFSKQPSVNTTKQPINFSNTVSDIITNVYYEFLLGKPLDDVNLFEKWFQTTSKLSPILDRNPGANDAAQKVVIDQMFAFVENTPVVKSLKRRPLFNAEMVKEILFFVGFFANAGVRAAAKTATARYLNLPDDERLELVREANWFFRQTSACTSKHHEEEVFTENFEQLEAISAFALEVFRFGNPVHELHAHARKDFVVDSLNGRFQIRKGDHLIAQVYIAGREPSTFEDPKEFDMNRNVCHTKKNLFVFGGPYNQKAIRRNSKCIGQSLALDTIKMLVLQLARCKLEVTAGLTFTEKDGRRSIGTDEDMIANKFSCKKLRGF